MRRPHESIEELEIIIDFLEGCELNQSVEQLIERLKQVIIERQ